MKILAAFAVALTLLVASHGAVAQQSGEKVGLVFAPQKDGTGDVLAPMPPSKAHAVAVAELKKMGFTIEAQEEGVRIKATRQKDMGAELRRSGFPNAQGAVIHDTAELAFTARGAEGTAVTITTTRLARNPGSMQIVFTTDKESEKQLRAVLTSEAKPAAPASSTAAKPAAVDPQAVQLKLKKVTSTRSAQPFTGQLRLDPSGRLEALVHDEPPPAGHVFWICEVEFANPRGTEMKIEDSKLEVRTPDGEWLAWRTFLQKAYMSAKGSWTLSGKQKKTVKFLTEVPESVQQIFLTYEGGAPLTITSR